MALNKKEVVSIVVKINGELAGNTLAELRAKSKSLQRTLNHLSPGTRQFDETQAELAAVKAKISDAYAEQRRLTNELKKTSTRARGLRGIFQRIGPALGPLLIAGGIAQVGRKLLQVGKDALRLLDIQQKADAQLKATLKSTNEAAGRSFDQLKEQAKELQSLSLFGDETIQGAQGILLTFTNIRKEIFDRTTPAVLDMATAFKIDLKTASITLGKALNDPIKGVTALSRVGIQFTDDQKKMIEGMVEAGDVAGAQKIILAELEKQVKGSAKAAAESGLGPWQQLGNRMDDIKEGVGELITQGLDKLAPIIKGVVLFVEKFVDALLSGKKATGEMSVGVNSVITVLKGLYGYLIFVFKELKLIVFSVATAFSIAVALIQQVWNTIKTTFLRINYSLRAVALQIKRAFTFDLKLREKLQKEIDDLKGLEKAASEAGERNAKAYGLGFERVYNSFYGDSGKSPADIPVPNATAPTTGNAPGGDFNPTGGDPSAALDLALKKEKASAKKLELLAALQYNNREIAEKEHQERILKIREDAINKQLDILDKYGKGESARALELKVELAELHKKSSEEELKELKEQIKEKSTIETIELQRQLVNRDITEDEYRKRVIKQKISTAEATLAVLQKTGQEETVEYRKIEVEKIQLERELSAEQLAFKRQLSTVAAKEEELMLREKLAMGFVSEEEYKVRTLELKRREILETLAILREGGQEETVEYRKLNAEKIEVDKELSEEKITEKRALITREITDESLLLQKKYLEGLLAEREYNAQLLQVKIEAIDRNLQLLKDSGREDTIEYKKLLNERLKLEKEYISSQKKIKEQAGKVLNEILQQSGQVLGELTSTIREDYQLYKQSLDDKYYRLVENGRLSREEADKQKSEELRTRQSQIQQVKAFEVAEVGINVAAEVSSIWRNANSNPLNAIIPGWGVAFAAVQTAAALLRARNQVRQIELQKFRGSGQVTGQSFPAKASGIIQGPSHEDGGVRFYTRNGFVGEAEGGEVILNRTHQILLGGEETFRRIGVPGFRLGGAIPAPNTTPVPSVAQNISSVTPNEGFDDLISELRRVASDMQGALTDVRAYVVYNDIQEAEGALRDITNQSSI